METPHPISHFHPKKKGTLGETRIAVEFARLGYPVFRELGDLSRIDQIVELPDGRLVKVQVKCLKSRKGAVVLDREKRGPGYRFSYQAGDVDVFAVYAYDWDEVFFVPASLLVATGRTLNFRLQPTRNGQN